MAGRRPPKEHQFCVGKSGNPGGRPKTPDDVLKARKLTRLEFERTANRMLFYSKAELKAALDRPECSMVEAIVGSLIVKAVQAGDPVRLTMLLDRLIGKVKDEVEVAVPHPVVIRRLNGEELILGAQIIPPHDAHDRSEAC